MGQEFHYGYFVPEGIPLAKATSELTKQMLERAELVRGARVLDIGCGTGRQACDLAAEHGAEVLGITTSRAGVAAATALAAELDLPGATFEQRDGTDTGLSDGAFDVVWALESSHLMRDRPAMLAECARLLAPNGRLVLCDIIRRREVPFLEVRARRDDLATLRAAFGDANMRPLEEYASTLEELGMTVLDVSDISDPTVPTLGAWRANCERHAIEIERLIGRQGLADFVASTHILEGFWHDRTLGYGILSATKSP